MSVKDCLIRLVESGQVTRATAHQAQALWERYQGRYSLDMPAATAEQAAVLEAARVLGQSAKEQRQSVALQVRRQTAAEQEQMAHPYGPAAGGMSILTRDVYMLGAENVDTRMETLRRVMSSKFAAGMEAYRSTLLGLRKDVAGAQNMVRELFGVDTGDATAKAAAGGWREATKYGIEFVQKAGKIFEANEDWRLPQSWNGERVKRLGGDHFKRDIFAEVDSGALKIWDKERFEFASDRTRMEAIVAKAARDIVTEGGGGQAFSAEMRTFQFQEGSAGAEAWIRMQAKYGPGQDILSTLTSHINSMAREGALVDILGPQHAATVEMLARNAKAWEKADATALQKARPISLIGMESSKAIERTYAVLNGRANAVDSAAVSTFLGSLRSLTVAAKMGSTIIPAVIGDSVTLHLAAKWNGTSFGRVMGRAIESLTASPEAKADAARLLVVAHGMSDHAIGMLRYADQIGGADLAKKAASAVTKITGLEQWTEGMKKAFTTEMLGYVAGQARNTLDKVDEPFRKFLEKYRVSRAEWNELRKRPLADVNGAKFFDSSAAESDPVARKLFEGILQERAFAVLEPDARVRNMTTAGAPSGSFAGEVARNGFMFKSFSMTMLATHMMRLAVEDGSIGSKMANAAWFTVLHVAAGAMILQARNVLQGKDPISMDQPKFWFQAASQGGGAGYYGDLVFAAAEGGNRSIVSQVAGPVAGMADDTINLARSVVSKTYAGQGGSAVSRGLDLVKSNTPGSTIWFARLAMDRLIFDRLQRAIDPRYGEAFARKEQAAMKAYGQQFWWRPGEAAPQRAPHL